MPTAGDKVEPAGVEPVCHELVDFFRRNPNASDTVDGIARWWLQTPVERVEPALEALVKVGVVEKLERADAVIYRAAAETVAAHSASIASPV
jgi:hypothetical protein